MFAYDVAAKDRDERRQHRRDDEHRRASHVLHSTRDHCAPGRKRRRHTEAEERKHSLVDDHFAEVDRRRDNERPNGVGQDVRDDYARVGKAEGSCCQHMIARAKLDGAVEAMCEQLINKLPECIRYTKQQLNFWRALSWHLTLGHARGWLAIHNLAPEVPAGITAFVEKRPVDYDRRNASER